MKLIDFGHTVNVSLGLPIIRTSVDHGTAFDIAGKNLADPTSMKAAMSLAVKMALGRRGKSNSERWFLGSLNSKRQVGQRSTLPV